MSGLTSRCSRRGREGGLPRVEDFQAGFNQRPGHVSVLVPLATRRAVRRGDCHSLLAWASTWGFRVRNGEPCRKRAEVGLRSCTEEGRGPGQRGLSDEGKGSTKGGGGVAGRGLSGAAAAVTPLGLGTETTGN